MIDYYLDSNSILRFLLSDNLKQARDVQNILRQAKKELVTVYIPFLAFFESVFILAGVYKFSRTEISAKLMKFINLTFLQIEKRELLLKILQLYPKFKVSFVDLAFLNESQMMGKKLFTFDQKLKKLKI